MKKCLYAGSFDPFTLGHFEIVQKALKLFDQVHIVVAQSASKKNLFTPSERENQLIELFKSESKVVLAQHNGLIVDYAKEHSIEFLVRGIRSSDDFELENSLAAMNHKLLDSVETILIPADPNYQYISSSLVKEVALNNGEVSHFVPSLIKKACDKKLKGS